MPPPARKELGRRDAYLVLAFVACWSGLVIRWCVGVVRDGRFRVGRRHDARPVTAVFDPLSFWGVVAGSFAVALIVLGIGVAVAVSAHRREARRVRGAEGRCPRCGYDLRATPGRCPECGRVPADPSRSE